MRKIALGFVLLLMLAALYLACWPVAIDPVSWTPPTAPPLTGIYAPNDILAKVQRLAAGLGQGPEGIGVDPEGRVYAGYDDGRVVAFAADGASYRVLANTGGRPLGIALGADGSVWVADAKRGLLKVDPNTGTVTLLADAASGRRFGFVDDVDVDRATGVAYFSDASDRHPFPDYLSDILEHRPHGRLLRYDPAQGRAEVLLDGLQFANGVALGPDAAYVLVNETGAYRIIRYWLKGDRAGTHDVFVGNLPGFPDNLSFNGRDRFWVALASPRDAMLDAVADKPGVRRLIARLPEALRPGPAHHGFVLGIDPDGKVVANLQDAGRGAYSPITSVEESGPWLVFGSLSEPSLARLPLNRAVPGAAAPPAGADQEPGPLHRIP